MAGRPWDTDNWRRRQRRERKRREKRPFVPFGGSPLNRRLRARSQHPKPEIRLQAVVDALKAPLPKNFMARQKQLKLRERLRAGALRLIRLLKSREPAP